MTEAALGIQGPGPTWWSGAVNKFQAAPRGAKLLAGAGVIDTFAGGKSNIFEKALNMAGIASIFCPILMPFVAAAYLLRSGFDILGAAGCLLRGDLGGTVSNLVTASVNAFCALPVGKIKNVYNLLRAKSLKEIRIGAEELEKLGYEAIAKRINASKATLQSISRGLSDDLAKIERGMIKAAKEAEGEVAVEAAEKTGKKAVNARFIEQTKGRLQENIKEHKDSIDPLRSAKDEAEKGLKELGEQATDEARKEAQDAAAKLAEAEKALKQAEEKAKAFEKMNERRDEIQTLEKEVATKSRNVNDLVDSKSEEELTKIINNKKGITIYEVDPKLFAQNSALEAYGENAVKFNGSIDKVFETASRPDGIKNVASDTLGKLRSTVSGAFGKNGGNGRSPIQIPTPAEARRYSRENFSDETVRRELAKV